MGGPARIRLDDFLGPHPVASELHRADAGMGGAGQHGHAEAACLGDGQRGHGAAEHVGLELGQGPVLRAAADGAKLAGLQAGALAPPVPPRFSASPPAAARDMTMPLSAYASMLETT